MMLAFGAAASAIDSLFGLASTKQAQSAGSGQDQPNLFAFQADATTSTGSTAASTSGGCSSISPETMSALLAAQSQASTVAPKSREDALKDLFGQIDADGDGKITKKEFENALGAGGTNLAQADDVFGKLDKNGDDSVSLGEMSGALKGGHGHHHGHHHMAEGSDDASHPLSQALQGATSTTVTNADGSITTSLTYADGSKVTMTSPAASTASGASSKATSSYNFIEQLIQRQANLISSQASSALSVSV
jgi:hypothetical protein